MAGNRCFASKDGAQGGQFGRAGGDPRPQVCEFRGDLRVRFAGLCLGDDGARPPDISGVQRQGSGGAQQDGYAQVSGPWLQTLDYSQFVFRSLPGICLGGWNVP